MADCHPYRIATTRGESTLIWRPGEGDDPDALAVDDLGRLLTFRDLATLEDHCDRNGWELVREGEATLDLAAVRRWVETPDDGPVSAGQLLEAWNFFDDLSHSLDDHPALPSRGPLQDRAYEKIFGGEALEPTAADGAWTDEETAAVRELLRSGLEFWERAVNASVTA
ncbi:MULTISPECIES: hypothetical protein [unclassified Streptomyces]|uniref:hypothetical protein n=1 Tax=unclassified Streptomyces TaxID=2593676 RepID=UPI00070E7BD0|nr:MULTISPECIES: hypothetical protein [unclassified Streptomyces]KRD06262.1 hypothetical protein ASE41_32205 [Streptomyces sp. Root264]